MTPKQFSALCEKASVLRSKLNQMELALYAGRSTLVKSTKMVKDGNGKITLSDGNRVVVLIQNRYRRYIVKVDGVVTNTDSHITINEARLALAMGYDFE